MPDNSSNPSLEGFRSTLNELKAQSDTAFGTLTDARSSLANVQELRTIVSSSIQDIQPYVDGGEESLKWKATKDTLHSLQSECFQSQQVADLLRDRLQSLGGELIDAKNRVVELETAQAEDRAAICRGNATIARTAEELSALVAYANKQRGELYDALSAAADYEGKLNSASSRINDMQGLLQRKEEEMQVLTGVQRDLVKLQDRIAEQNVYIAKLEGVKNEVAVMQTAIGDRDARIAELTVVSASHERDLRGLADQLAEMTMSAQSLKEDLGASKAREEAMTLENQRICDEQKTVVERVRDLEVILARVRQDLDTRSERYYFLYDGSDIAVQALEERFEDQSVTLRITRESAGDIQERLLSAETSHAKELAEVDAKYKQEIAVLHEQKLGLQTAVNVLETALKGQEAAIKALQDDNTNRLTELNAAHAQRLEQEGKHLQRLTDDLTDSRARIVASETRAARLDEDVRDLYRQLKEAQLPSPEVDAEMRSLRSEVTRLEGAEMQNILRTKTIESRYRTGDLNEEERAFINNLVRTSQAIHEQELVANRNELRRRDNALKEMRAKIHLLESTLSRHINPPKAKTAPPTIDSRSMIDPTAWMSSGQSSSPVQAPDRDGQTNVDDAVPAKLSPASNIPTGVLPAAQTASAHTPMPTAELVRKTPPEAKAVGAVQAKKPNFSRLATDCSDEILDFDDEHAGHGPGSATSLGKRTKPSSPLNNDGGPVIPKPLKRLRTTVRKVAVTEEAHAVVSAKKAIQPSSSKNRARKRR
ncbi:hypothetical protein BD413DRAFT_475623 [Trametes elegans]|nr:hypothetical protein BD413DRAFT_475623 [Trametes elegans]